MFENYKSIALLGMAKNTGKTTTLNHMIAIAHERGIPIALTSIGRDGETLDIVTATKKPRIHVQADTIIATAEGLLTPIAKEILDVTDIRTPLGRVVVLRTLDSGYVELAGPSTVRDLAAVMGDSAGGSPALRANEVRPLAHCVCWPPSRSLRSLAGWPCIGGHVCPYNTTDRHHAHHSHRIFFVDGAVGRISHLSACAAVILCTGAALHPRMDTVIAKTRHMAKILTLPQATTALTHDGALTDENYTKNAVVRHPSNIFLTSEHLLNSVSVLHPVYLLAITINPYSPYGKGFDATEFLDKMRMAVDVPVLDVVSDLM